MPSIALSIPARFASFKVFQHPPMKSLTGLSGGTVRLGVPPLHGVEITMGAMTRPESLKLASEISLARNNEVSVRVPDQAQGFTGGALTVASVAGLALTLTGWTGTWADGKRLSIVRGAGGRRYIVPTTGAIVANVIQMASTPRVTFQAGDVVSYNQILLEGFLENAEGVLEEIQSRGVQEGMTFIVKERL
jgi:hypothetical protein